MSHTSYPPVKPSRISPYTAEEHRQFIIDALSTCDVSPYAISWHYLNLVFKSNGGCINETAVAVGKSRRTVQRSLDKACPR